MQGFVEHPSALLWDRIHFNSARAAHQQRKCTLVGGREGRHGKCEVTLWGVSCELTSYWKGRSSRTAPTYREARWKSVRNHTCRHLKSPRCHSARRCSFQDNQKTRLWAIRMKNNPHSKTRSPRPHITIALTGKSRGACSKTSTRVLAGGPDCVVVGTRRWYCGFTMYVAKV